MSGAEPIFRYPFRGRLTLTSVSDTKALLRWALPDLFELRIFEVRVIECP